ncbi:putative ATP-dependent RNA helicase Dbp73D [Amphibalanus amphitrite]|uniref:ATP-dependent RNA helicase n=2 Tax=Amphibalanus amphitrite TaxID=1232801 RepID=A0A6A4WNS4_AMPAM|nr:putative ATP-dependent RNA helicase Dbp73D [Amphibalanus amphitrite]
MADLTERTAAAAVANNDSEDTSESDGDAAADDFTVLDEPIGDRRPAPANLPALCPELPARLAAEGIEQVFLVQVTVLPELLAAAESPLPPADLCVSAPAGRGKTLPTRRPEKLERMSLFQPRLLVAGTAAAAVALPGQFVGRFTTPAELSESFNVVAPQPLKPLLMHNLLRQPDWRRSLVLVNWNEVAHQLELPLSVLSAREAEFPGALNYIGNHTDHEEDPIILWSARAGGPCTAALPDWLAHPQPIGDRHPAPANLSALCRELRARLAAEGIERLFLVQVTVLPELLAAAESPLPPADLYVSAPAGRGKTLAFVLPLVQAAPGARASCATHTGAARSGARRVPPKLSFLATLSRDPQKLERLSLFLSRLLVAGTAASTARVVAPQPLKPLLMHHLLRQPDWRRSLLLVNSKEAAHRLELPLSVLGAREAEFPGAVPAGQRRRRRVSHDISALLKAHCVRRTARVNRGGQAVTLMFERQRSHFQRLMAQAGKADGRVRETPVPLYELRQYEATYVSGFPH